MNKTILSALIVISGLFSTGAIAEDQPAAYCQLKFSAQTDTFILINTGRGRGSVTCYADGVETARARVQIAIEGFGPGLGHFEMRGVAARIEVTSPEQVEGVYTVGAGNIGVGGAAGTLMGFTRHGDSLHFEASSNSRGVGAMLAGTNWTITLE